MVKLAIRRRTWTTIANGSKVVRTFAKGIVPLQLSRGPRNVIDNPVMKSSRNRCIVIRYGKREAIGPFGNANPVEFGRDIGASTAELVELGTLWQWPAILKIGTG